MTVVVLAWIFALAGLAGAIYQVMAAYFLRCFLAGPRRIPSARPPLSVLKPLCGDEPGLAANLESLLRQEYPDYQVICGTLNPTDSALPVARRLSSACGKTIDVVSETHTEGRNLKVSSLINMLPKARGDIVVIADSDVLVPESHLDDIAATLAKPGVGVATAVYIGRPEANLWSRLGALAINHGFLPSILVARALGRNDGCFGATIALRRSALERIGGFSRLRDVLADDWALGAEVRSLGERIDILARPVETVVNEPTLKTLFAHEVRWGRTVAAVDRAGLYRFANHPAGDADLAGVFDWSKRVAVDSLVPGRSGPLGGDPLRRTAFGLAKSAVRPIAVARILEFCRLLGRRMGPDRGMARSTLPHQGGRYRRIILRNTMKKTLFLNPPSYEGFDGGAGSRYQAKREVRSFWYPTWLAQVAALIPGSRLIDAPARGLSLEDILPLAGDYEMLILYVSAPTFYSDVHVAEAFKKANPRLMIGLCGAHVATSPVPSLEASMAVDFIARHEFDYTIKEIAEDRPFAEVDGITWRRDGEIVSNPDRALIHDMDALPSVASVYKRDLVIEDYYIGYLKHPYMSYYSGRGCRSRCTFCLWPQTIGGHTYRSRSAAKVIEDIAEMHRLFPQVQEFFFDDDTFTDDRERVEEIARGLGKLGVIWSCNAKANVPYDTLKVMKENGLRLLLVGYESGVQDILNNVRKGTRIDVIRRFSEDCRKLGIAIHGTFIIGLPGETRETIEETIRFAKEVNPHTIQVSLAAPYPGTELYKEAQEKGWMKNSGLVADDGLQTAALGYPHLSADEIYESVAKFYKAFYFRPSKIAEIVFEMLKSWDMTCRRLREGVEFFHFLRTRHETGAI